MILQKGEQLLRFSNSQERHGNVAHRLDVHTTFLRCVVIAAAFVFSGVTDSFPEDINVKLFSWVLQLYQAMPFKEVSDGVVDTVSMSRLVNDPYIN